jgi:heme-degrading monooxygenase HmoA
MGEIVTIWLVRFKRGGRSGSTGAAGRFGGIIEGDTSRRGRGGVAGGMKMYVVRDIFRCKPGKAKELVAKFKQSIKSMEQLDGFSNVRLMVDAVADYWTVVLESDVATLEQFEQHLREWGTRPDVREAMDGYMELVEGGRREIFRIA